MKKFVLFDIDYTLFDTEYFRSSNLSKHKVYDEVSSVLDELSKFAELGILSKGELSFQKNKLLKTKIEKYFQRDHTFIVADKLTEMDEILKKYEGYKLYLVDDRLQILEKAKRIFPSVTTIWVKRGPFAFNKSQFTPDSTIEDLTRLVSVISS